GIEIDRLVGVSIGNHAGQPHSALAAARAVSDHAGMLLLILDEQGSQAANDSAMRWSGNFGHVDDPPGQFVGPAIFPIGFDEFLKRHPTTFVGRADPESGGSSRGGHSVTSPGRGEHNNASLTVPNVTRYTG